MANRTIALDLDGTVLDARARHCALVKWCADANGIGPVDLKRHWRLKRQGLSTVAALARVGVEPAVATRVGALWRAHVEDPEWLDMDEPLPGVGSVIRSIASEGDAVVLVTARRRPHRAVQQLARFGLDSLFADVRVVDPVDAAMAKADYLRWSSAVGFIGDTEVDAQAALVAGVPFVAVTTGLRSARYLGSIGCRSADSLRGALAAVR